MLDDMNAKTASTKPNRHYNAERKSFARFVIFSIPVLFLFAGKTWAADILPKCFWPKDFSASKFVASYEACLQRQQNFCKSHLTSKDCEKLSEEGRGKPYYKVTVDDIDPVKRCKIEKDGSYKCLQDPIRLVGADTHDQVPSAPAPSGSAAPGSPGQTQNPNPPQSEFKLGTEDENDPGNQNHIVPPPGYIPPHPLPKK